jgi:hypothetical protein
MSSVQTPAPVDPVGPPPSKPADAVAVPPPISAESGGLQLPPPPPPLDPLPTRAQSTMLASMFGAGALTALIGTLVDFRYAGLMQQGGAFFATYAALVAASWLPPSVLTRRVDKLLDRWVRNSATGYYGVMALAAFGVMEAESMIEGIANFDLDFSMGNLVQVIVQTVIGMSIDSIKNFGLAMGWPGTAVLSTPAGAMPGFLLVALTWGAFRIGSKVLPHASFELRKPKKAKKEKKKKLR